MHALAKARLEHEIVNQMQQANVPGLAVALVGNDRVLYTNVFGSSRTARTPLTPISLFQAASLSKPGFAYGVLALWQRGGLDLDTPICIKLRLRRSWTTRVGRYGAVLSAY